MGRTKHAEFVVSRRSLGQRIMRHWQLYLIILIPAALLILFSYVPMYGIILAFKNYKVRLGITGSPWLNPPFKNFTKFFYSYYFVRLLKNTLMISIYQLLAGFPIAILLALMINECRRKKFAKMVQMVTYAPYFISTVVLVSMILLVLSPKTGVVSMMVRAFGGTPVDLMSKPEYFRHIYVWSGIWQGTGFSSVIYIAALAGVDPSLHEAATVDGANRFRRVWHVDLPGIRSTIIILLILSVGSVMSVGYEKVLLMQNNLNRSASDIISTYVYSVGLLDKNYGLSTAVGIFNSVVNIILLGFVNTLSRKLTDTSLL